LVLENLFVQKDLLVQRLLVGQLDQWIRLHQFFLFVLEDLAYHFGQLVLVFQLDLWVQLSQLNQLDRVFLLILADLLVQLVQVVQVDLQFVQR
jgi:hypothetical protein